MAVGVPVRSAAAAGKGLFLLLIWNCARLYLLNSIQNDKRSVYVEETYSQDMC